ncbi:LOW QUALITY PROTEIN: hematopoietic cell signal transducer [Castor canadensis]|uniref:Hematopoietic cell signal transducer n=1 Tax=Castor canadensis TaxID=51338 RepID=A0A8B7UVN5_CASCN|nr:LOW QUALITY PROTEIN: hematopoietic cell signal transducer [Castor canadensis]
MDPLEPQSTMTTPDHMLILLLFPVAAAQMSPGERQLGGQWPGTSGSCSGCGPLSLPLLAGLVVADAVMSLVIVGVVFACARSSCRPAQDDGTVYINMPGWN